MRGTTLSLSEQAGSEAEGSEPAGSDHALVRQLRPTDLDALEALCALHAEYERAPWQEDPARTTRWRAQFFGERPRARGWIAVSGATALGFAVCTLEYSTWRAAEYLHLDCMFVTATHRRGGLGRQLFAAVTTFAASEGVDRVEWQTPQWNQVGVQFYTAIGATSSTKERFVFWLQPLESTEGRDR